MDAEELISEGRKRVELRDMLIYLGHAPPDVHVLKAVLSRCSDVDLALTAMTMTPPPAWVTAIVGK
jgi:hypothetical protein